MKANPGRWLSGINPELAHRLAFGTAWLADRIASSYLRGRFAFDDPVLRQQVWGVDFSNPIGLAAGCDKNALLLPFWEKLGFGHVEVGSVTLYRSHGNRRPRLFRLPEDRAIINRLGLPSKGAELVAKRLSHVPAGKMPIGINIARADRDSSVVEDYCLCATRMLPHANYLTINISCPNTTGGKIPETPEILESLLQVLIKQVDKRTPILLKLAPPDTSRVVYDSQTDAILETAIRCGINGFVVTNTAEDRLGLVTDEKVVNTIGHGGLSGPPIYQRAVQMIRYVRTYVGPDYPIIGVGGIASAKDAYTMIRAGASLIQLYTALVYEGPGIVQTIKQDLVKLLRLDGYTSVASAVGTAQKVADPL